MCTTVWEAGKQADQLCSRLTWAYRLTCGADTWLSNWKKQGKVSLKQQRKHLFCIFFSCVLFAEFLPLSSSSVLYQMWSFAWWWSPAVHRRDVDRTLYSPGGHTATREHNWAGEIRDPPLPSNQADWETARHRWVSTTSSNPLLKKTFLDCRWQTSKHGPDLPVWTSLVTRWLLYSTACYYYSDSLTSVDLTGKSVKMVQRLHLGCTVTSFSNRQV